jgi:hypothetical protein
MPSSSSALAYNTSGRAIRTLLGYPFWTAYPCVGPLYFWRMVTACYFIFVAWRRTSRECILYNISPSISSHLPPSWYSREPLLQCFQILPCSQALWRIRPLDHHLNQCMDPASDQPSLQNLFRDGMLRKLVWSRSHLNLGFHNSLEL